MFRLIETYFANRKNILVNTSMLTDPVKYFFLHICLSATLTPELKTPFMKISKAKRSTAIQMIFYDDNVFSDAFPEDNYRRAFFWNA